jgi:cyanophycinase
MSAEQKPRWQNWMPVFSKKRNQDTRVNDIKVRRKALPRLRIVFWACAFLMTVGVGVYLRAEIHRRVSRFSNESLGVPSSKGGTLLIVGGGDVSGIIRRQFIELAGHQAARIVVIPAMTLGKDELPPYREPWDSYDVKSVDILYAESRSEAEDAEFSSILDSATGVWLAGGQQTWLAARYGQTRVETRLKELLARNGVIGGTSAGAAIMSGVMIAGGRQKPTIGRGFDLIPGAIIDQHFLKRNRFRRLQNALEQHPELIGFGIDEGTALQFGVASGRFRVIGQSCVIACVPHADSEDRLSFQLEFLNPGDEFDIERLRRGDPVPPGSIDLDSILLGE